MENLKTINEISDNLISELLKNKGAFFAFSQDQFNEQKKENEIYVNLPGGLICPKSNAKALHEEMNLIYKSAIKEQVSLYGAEAIIEREYFNYETQISGDLTDLKNYLSFHIELFPDLFTDDIINKVSTLCFQKALAEDWF